MSTVPTLSTGQPSTLGVWRDNVASVFGEDNDAVRYFDNKIVEQGRDEPVVAAESQVMHLVASLLGHGVEAMAMSREDSP